MSGQRPDRQVWKWEFLKREDFTFIKKKITQVLHISSKCQLYSYAGAFGKFEFPPNSNSGA